MIDNSSTSFASRVMVLGCAALFVGRSGRVEL